MRDVSNVKVDVVLVYHYRSMIEIEDYDFHLHLPRHLDGLERLVIVSRILNLGAVWLSRLGFCQTEVDMALRVHD